MKSKCKCKLQIIKPFCKKIIVYAITSGTMIGTYVQYAYAEGSGDVTVPLNAMKTIGISFVSGLGVLVAIKGISVLGKGIKERDSNGIAAGAAELGGGAIMAGCGAVLTIMGF